MKKNFIVPEMEVKTFSKMSVITLSDTNQSKAEESIKSAVASSGGTITTLLWD